MRAPRYLITAFYGREIDRCGPGGSFREVRCLSVSLGQFDAADSPGSPRVVYRTTRGRRVSPWWDWIAEADHLGLVESIERFLPNCGTGAWFEVSREPFDGAYPVVLNVCRYSMTMIFRGDPPDRTDGGYHFWAKRVSRPEKIPKALVDQALREDPAEGQLWADFEAWRIKQGGGQ